LKRELWVVVEHREEEIVEASLEVLTEARRLAGKTEATVSALVLGRGVSKFCETLGPHGADKIYLFEHALLEHYTTDGFSTVLGEALRKYQVPILLMANTALGKDLAPRLAARLDAGLITDCTVLNINDKGVFEMTRPTCGNRVYATYTCPETVLQIVTVRPGVLGTGRPMKGRTAEVETLDVDLGPDTIRTKVLGYSTVSREEMDITEADVVLAFGRGVQDQSHIGEMEALAEFINASVGGSRVSVDEGWIPFERQIGQTGKTISPKFIMCCGISGAQQFTMGMRDSQFIVAVNKDRHAPIFRVADVSVLGDMHVIIPMVVEELQKMDQATNGPPDSK
jgi:electron transfer flavoprotein alpha subunit